MDSAYENSKQIIGMLGMNFQINSTVTELKKCPTDLETILMSKEKNVRQTILIGMEES